MYISCLHRILIPKSIPLYHLVRQARGTENPIWPGSPFAMSNALLSYQKAKPIKGDKLRQHKLSLNFLSFTHIKGNQKWNSSQKTRWNTMTVVLFLFLTVHNLCSFCSQTPVSFLCNRQFDTFSFWKWNPRLVSFANHKHIAQSEKEIKNHFILINKHIKVFQKLPVKSSIRLFYKPIL